MEDIAVKYESIAGCLDYARNAILGPDNLMPKLVDKLAEAEPDSLEAFIALVEEDDVLARLAEADAESLARASQPCVVLLSNDNAMLLAGPSSDIPGNVLMFDPLAPDAGINPVDFRLLEDKYSGQVLEYTVRLPHPLLRNFAALAQHHGVDVTLESLVHEYAVDDQLEMAKLARIGKDIGFKVRKKQISLEKLAPHFQLFPLIGLMEDQPVVIRGIDLENRRVDTIDISHAPPLEREYTFEEYEAASTGNVILLKRHFKITDKEQPFGLRWFVPEFLRHKRIFRDVIIAAVLLQVVALAMPLFFQVVVDKVLVHRSVTTLSVLGAGILLAIGFETCFSYARGFILLYGVNKIDVRVATATFRKLASLPVSFFDSNRSGILIKHMQQAENIRSFLTGRVLFSALDGFSLCVFLPVLFFYSPLLCGIVLAFSALMALVILAIIPSFRRRLYELYEADGQRQSFLVETIQGMNTVKSLSLESKRSKEWDNRVAQAINMNFKVGKLSIAATTVTGLLEKVMLVLVIWIGVYKVFDNSLTIGSLIAFQMISSRVSSPLVQIVSLIHEYQETALSVKMLGSIMNEESEYSITQRGITPGIRGGVEFANVTFSYAPTLPAALEGVSFIVPPGTVLGIAGRSGSGKSTISRLVQGLYKTRNGAVKVDGFDINDLELPHLRQAIGVVLQDDFIFHGTVRENIQSANPGASFEKVVHCAKLAGADEFIQRLPKGFDTLLEENGANLSGGQKQRLAIARALLGDPKILILDEATSALDAESERIVNENLRHIARGRTLLVISHRLSMIANADAILVLDGGKVVGHGPHARLLHDCDLYRSLWRTQTQFATND